MADELELECPCCGDVGAVADSDGRFWDGQELVCGCPGQVSCDVETEPDISIGDLECVACKLRAERDRLKVQLVITTDALEEYADHDNWAKECRIDLWKPDEDGFVLAELALADIEKVDEPLPKPKPTTRTEQRAFLKFAEEHERLMAEQPNSTGMIEFKCPSCGSDPDVDCICKGQNG